MLGKEKFQKMMLFLVTEDAKNILSLQREIIASELDVPSNFSIIAGYLESDGKFQPI